MQSVYCNVHCIYVLPSEVSFTHGSECHCHLLESQGNVIITKRKTQENISHFVIEATSYQDVRLSKSLLNPLNSKIHPFFSVSLSFCYVLSLVFFILERCCLRLSTFHFCTWIRLMWVTVSQPLRPNYFLFCYHLSLTLSIPFLPLLILLTALLYVSLVTSSVYLQTTSGLMRLVCEWSPVPVAAVSLPAFHPPSLYPVLLGQFHLFSAPHCMSLRLWIAPSEVLDFWGQGQ